MKRDVSIAQNEVTHNLDCDIIIAAVENWQIDKNYTHFVTIHFSNHFQVYPNGQTAKVRSTSDLSNHRRLLRMSNTSLLAQLMYTDVSRGVPPYTAYTKCFFQGCPTCNSPKRSSGPQKKTSNHLEQTIFAKYDRYVFYRNEKCNDSQGAEGVQQHEDNYCTHPDQKLVLSNHEKL